ncbi:MAG: glycoside hydrolase family 88 protein [Mangrovibacterium sp.]
MKFISLLTVQLLTLGLFAQDLPSKQEVLERMQLANAYFMKKWPDPGKTIVTNKERPSNIWTRATYYEGLMALYRIDDQQKLLDYATNWAEFHNWETAYSNYSRNADNLCCGQTYLDLYLIDPQDKRISTIRETADRMIASDKIDDWNWIDALQMGMPVFARLGAITGEKKYWNRMYEMYLCTRNSLGGNGLFNPKDGLWWRDADFVPPYQEPNGEDCYWSRGNGWVLAAMARVLEQNPPDKKQRKEYQRMLKTMTKALSKVQRPDGFWNVSLHDPDHFGGPETTGTAFFVYGIAWGINRGHLNRAKYLPVVLKGWEAISKEALHTDGFLGYVQGTGKDPSAGQPVSYDSKPDFEDYGLGAFLLAGSEVYRLAR